MFPMGFKACIYVPYNNKSLTRGFCRTEGNSQQGRLFSRALHSSFPHSIGCTESSICSMDWGRKYQDSTLTEMRIINKCHFLGGNGTRKGSKG